MVIATQPYDRQASTDIATALAPFVHQWAAHLTTFRRNGTPVGTPVNIAVEGDHAFIRTWEASGKMKLMRIKASWRRWLTACGGSGPCTSM